MEQITSTGDPWCRQDCSHRLAVWDGGGPHRVRRKRGKQISRGKYRLCAVVDYDKYAYMTACGKILTGLVSQFHGAPTCHLCKKALQTTKTTIARGSQ